MSRVALVDVIALTRLEGVVMRLVEPQEQDRQVTGRITDNMDEQAFLETFLEDSQPELPDANECPLRHPFLLTPFCCHKRYGSRFSTRWERGLFYGSRSRPGCLLEGAYYALVFQSGPERPFPKRSTMCKKLFHVEVSAEYGLQLQFQGDETLQNLLRHPHDYRFTQQVGQHMREAGIQAFEYHSARSTEAVMQIGVLSCGVFQSLPFDQVEIQVEANANEVIFHCFDDNNVYHFLREQFLVDGLLPQPAT